MQKCRRLTRCKTDHKIQFAKHEKIEVAQGVSEPDKKAIDNSEDDKHHAECKPFMRRASLGGPEFALDIKSPGNYAGATADPGGRLANIGRLR